MQKVRQQLRDLRYNKADVAAFNRRFHELATMLDLPSSSPYTSGLSCQTPSLQQSLDPAVLVSNSVGQTITLDNAIQLVTQFAARGTSHVPQHRSTPRPQLSGSLSGPHPHSPCPHSGPLFRCPGPEPHAGRYKCNGPRAVWPT